MNKNGLDINKCLVTTQLLKVRININLDYGPLRKINKPIHITDSDSEIQAWIRIFLFDKTLVIEFKI
jgi:hypothetical protein